MLAILLAAAAIGCDHSVLLTSSPPQLRCWNSKGETVFCLTDNFACQGEGVAIVPSPSALDRLPLVPDPAKTPGVVDPAKTVAVICVRGYTSQPGVRHVTAATKHRVFAAYGIDPQGPGAPFEIDHLISLELGGSNDIKNLWPQSYVTPTWNARDKDVLENELHRRVCRGELTLDQAQKAIATAWIAAHRQYLGDQAEDPAH